MRHHALKCLVLWAVCCGAAFSGAAAPTTFSIDHGEGTLSVVADVLYAQDIPYVSLSALLNGIGGAVRVLENDVQANYAGITALAAINEVSVRLPGRNLTLAHPLRVREGYAYAALSDAGALLEAAFGIVLERATETAPPPPLLAPIDPDDTLLEDEQELLLRTLPSQEPETSVESDISGSSPPDDDTSILPDVYDEEQLPETPSLDEPLVFKGVTRSIILDAGHGGSDNGFSLGAELLEKNITLDLTLRIRRLLKENTDIAVHLTRETDKSMTAHERVSRANATGGDVLFSIHGACSASPQRRGIVLLSDHPGLIGNVNSGTEQREEALARRQHAERGAVIAYRLLQALSIDSPLGPVALHAAPLQLQRELTMPCVLVEFPFMSNAECVSSLKEDTYLEQVASTLTNAIVSALTSP